MSETRRLWTLAWPVIVGQIGLVAMGVVDFAVAGAVDETALASVGLGNTWSFGCAIFGLGVASGVDPDITQAYGAGRPRDAGRAAIEGAVLLVLVGVFLTWTHHLAGPGLTALGQPADAIPGADVYSRVVGWSVGPLLGFSLLRQWLQGDGVMFPATAVILLGNLVNLAADLVFVVYLDGGVEGVAWATVVVRWAMFFGLLVVGWGTFRRAWPESPWPRPHRVLRLASIAVPVGAQVAFEVWAFNAATLLAGWLGSRAVAAHTAALSAASLAFMVPLGLSAAAATRVGNRVGAGLPWRRTAWTALAMGASVMTLSGAVFMGFPWYVARVYSHEPAVITSIMTVLPIAAAFGWFDGVQVVAMGILRGRGDTRVPAVIALAAYWVIGLPLGWLFLSEWGLRSVWMGLAVGLGVSALLGVARIAFLLRSEPAGGAGV